MKKILLLLTIFLALSVTSFAKFCIGCGESLPDKANFCAACGKKQPELPVTKPTSKPDTETSKKPEKMPDTANLKVYRAKTDIYLYEKRGDEKDALKKNLFFKPRRYRMKRNSQFRILESVGNSYLVQSIANNEGTTLQGWILKEQLILRSDWTP